MSLIFCFEYLHFSVFRGFYGGFVLRGCRLFTTRKLIQVVALGL